MNHLARNLVAGATAAVFAVGGGLHEQSKVNDQVGLHEKSAQDAYGCAEKLGPMAVEAAMPSDCEGVLVTDDPKVVLYHGKPVAKYDLPTAGTVEHIAKTEQEAADEIDTNATDNGILLGLSVWGAGIGLLSVIRRRRHARARVNPSQE